MSPDWISLIYSVLGTAGTLAVAWVLPPVREAVGKYVAGLVTARFDERLEKLKSELRQTEERFAAELRSRELQVKTLSEALLAAKSTRQASLDARRLLAAERVWIAKGKVDRLRSAAQTMAHINFEEAARRAATDPKIQQFFEMIDKTAGVNLDKPPDIAAPEEIFLPARIWQLFEAYKSVLFLSVAMLKLLGSGVGGPELINGEGTKNALKEALPEYVPYIEEYGFTGYYNLLDIIQQRLLIALQAMLDGSDLDVTSVTASVGIVASIELALDEAKAAQIPASIRAKEVPDPPPASPAASQELAHD